MRNEAMWHLCEEFFRYLDYKTLLKCRMVSKLWNELLERLALVKYLDEFEYKVAEFQRLVKKKSEKEVLITISGWNCPISRDWNSPFQKHDRQVRIVDSGWNKAVRKYDKQASIEDLRKLKCSLEDFDNSWRTHPVRDAIRHGLADELEIIFRNSYYIKLIDGKISLWWSNWGNHYEMAKWMLELAEENGTVDLNARDINGRTPFQVASFRGNAEVVKLILDYSKDKRGIDLNAKDDYGQTAFHLACKDRLSASLNAYNGPNSRAKETVQLILDFLKENDAIDLNARDNDGRTAFHCACEHNRCSEVAKCILDFSLENDAIDLNVRDYSGKTALHRAILHWARSKDIVKLILDFSREHDGIDLNAKNAEELTPFFMACRSSKIGAVKLMLDFSHHSDKIDFSVRSILYGGKTPCLCLFSKKTAKFIKQYWEECGINIKSQVKPCHIPYDMMCGKKGNKRNMLEEDLKIDASEPPSKIPKK